MKKILLSLSVLFVLNTDALLAQNLKIVAGKVDTARNSHHFFRGITDADAKIFVAGKEFPVYWTGAFAAEVRLVEGYNTVEIIARRGAEQTKETLTIFYEKRDVAAATQGFAIEKVEILPSGNMTVSEGDAVKIRVKATPNCNVTWLKNIKLHELPTDEANGVAGIYQSTYIVKNNDKTFDKPVQIRLRNSKKTFKKEISTQIKFIDKNSTPLMLRTKGELPYLNYGLGNDRLGGSKISHIVEGIVLQATGKVGNLYRVQISKNYQAWIPENCVNVAASGVFKPESLVSSWTATGNMENKCDVLTVSLSEKLPFRTFHEINPSRIVVDIFGAVANTAWITQYPETLKAIKNLNYEQIEDDIFRIVIELENNHWGHKIEYRGSNMVVTVKHQPKLELNGLHIAIDAGHGGEKSPGARGTTGCMEKTLNLKFTKMLQSKLEEKGAKVTLTRDEDIDVGTSDRILKLRHINPDLLVSMHCNAGGTPFSGKGTSTYYRHLGFRPLSTAILARLLELGVNNFGNVGSFNFALNSPTEYPNVLVETLFLSSPEDEAKILDDNFQNNMIDKIVLGLQDFLNAQKNDL